MMLVFKQDITGHPEAQRIYEPALRALTKETKVGFRKEFVSKLSEIDYYSKEGIYLGKTGSMDVDLSRLSAVMERTTRGLYLHHTGKRLPVNCDIQALSISGFHNPTPGLISKLVQIVEASKDNGPFVLGNNVVTYRYSEVEKERNITVWTFILFESEFFFVITGNKGLVRRNSAA